MNEIIRRKIQAQRIAKKDINDYRRFWLKKLNEEDNEELKIILTKAIRKRLKKSFTKRLFQQLQRMSTRIT